MVIDQAMECVHAPRTGSVEKRKSRGSRQGEAIAIGDDIGDVVRNQSVPTRQHLLLSARACRNARDRWRWLRQSFRSSHPEKCG